jgi:hypothetical protein
MASDWQTLNPVTLDTTGRWNSFSPVSVVDFNKTYITIPAFALTGIPNLAYSGLVAQFNYVLGKNASILGLLHAVSPNYCACIRYRIGGVVHRYRLHTVSGAVILGEPPIYHYQKVFKNFCIEIWSLPGLTIATNTAAINLRTSIQSAATDMSANIVNETGTETAVGANYTSDTYPFDNSNQAHLTN